MKKTLILLLTITLTVTSSSNSQDTNVAEITSSSIISKLIEKYGKSKTSIVDIENNLSSDLYFVLANNFNKEENNKYEFMDIYFKSDFDREEKKEKLKEFKKIPRIFIFEEEIKASQFTNYNFQKNEQIIKTELSNVTIKTIDDNISLYRYLEIDDIYINLKLPVTIAKAINEKKEIDLHGRIGRLISVFEYQGTYDKKILEKNKCVRYSFGQCVFADTYVLYKFIKLKHIQSNLIYENTLY
ncbi:hypothetical protein [Leptospira bandrabouensis]|uniref:Uncharacterized protein n=1 Tax=Leptospira bandrabouensis TaxID=2484903 RepID=A0A6H3NS72_9LEPT|nr:hypothetical protein [Leptospira bandrabouensis]TGN13337.1 hypothetical protein EHR08_11695 [Leptospira bandrabouensis]